MGQMADRKSLQLGQKPAKMNKEIYKNISKGEWQFSIIMHMNKNCDQHVRKIRKFYIGTKQRCVGAKKKKKRERAQVTEHV